MTEPTAQTTSEQQTPTKGFPWTMPDRKNIVVFSVSLALFIAAIWFPWHMVLRHEGSGHFSKNLLEIGRGIAYPYIERAQDIRVSDDHKKIGLAIYAMVLLVAARLWPKDKKIRNRIVHWSVTALLGWLMFVAFTVESGKTFLRFMDGRYVQTWNVFHYYMNSKYFDELGYYYLYPYVLKADAEQEEPQLKHVKWATDLFNYKRIPAAKSVQQVEGRNDFTPARWEEFKADLRYLYPQQRKSKWSDIFKDHGYNATPFWNFVGGKLANTFSIRNRWSRTFLFSLDMVFIVIAFGLVAWAFGLNWGFLMGIFFEILPFNEQFLVGGYLRYDWFCAAIMFFCFYKKGYYKTAAPFLAYGAMTRVFPGFLIVGPTILAGIKLVRERTLDRKVLNMILVFLLACAIFFALGGITKEGFAPWIDFLSKLHLHTSQHYLGPKRLGLKHLFIDDLSTPLIAKDPWQSSFDKQEGLYHISYIILMAMYLISLIRRNRIDASLMGYFLVFIMVVLSRYYWALVCMMFLLSEENRSRWRLVMSDTILLSLMPIFYTFRFQEHFPYSWYMPPTYWLLGYFVFLSGSFMAEDIYEWVIAARKYFAGRKRPENTPPSNEPAQPSET